MEKHYALLKNNRVMNVIVVEKQNDIEIQTFCDEMDYDEFIFTNDKKIEMHALRVNDKFVSADYDYLKSIGLSSRNNAEQLEWEAQFAGE
jgi:hypothetical protein